VDSGIDAVPLEDAAPDALPDPDAGTCSSLTPPAATITSKCPDPTAPAPSGGALVDGTYVLTLLASWSSGCGGYTTTLSEALRVHGATIELATDVKAKSVVDGGTGTRTSAFTATVQSDTKSISLAALCSVPADAGDVAQTLGAATYGFSAGTTELRFFQRGTDAPELLAVYTKQ
jgi:hypothetical protein